MERQALRDAVVRYNAEGLPGLRDRPRPGGPTPRLDEARRAALRRLVLDGPDVEATGLSAWTLGDLCREVEARWGVRGPRGPDQRWRSVPPRYAFAANSQHHSASGRALSSHAGRRVTPAAPSPPSALSLTAESSVWWLRRPRVRGR